MSEVISFRLDRNNPREAQALLVLKRGQEAGYTASGHVLTEALLALEAAAEDEQAVMMTLAELNEKLTEVQAALERIQGLDLTTVRRLEQSPEQNMLAESFLNSVKHATKPGIALDS